ncbi:hypothetical protein GCM10010287_29280 [Streptomyces variabilis]|uniref:Uncharacterized protein n=1 Tax=Streptomyces variabilis TaxID=67372 RepID=A0ABQ2U0X6_9ACTN|nr:hypothetical protein GCM10010265_41150 [Streptomyces griseoincarnatus]GGT53463.1 hypothetical protein GCM10010287_29280 [Streptomyces variabilis]
MALAHGAAGPAHSARPDPPRRPYRGRAGRRRCSRLACLTITRESAEVERPFRLGAAAYGPQAEELARDLVAHIDAWGSDRLAVPRMTVTPAGYASTAGHVITKPGSRITLTY